jgi:hypothetical protein
MYVPVPVAARSKELVCGRLPAEIVGLNPTGGMDIRLLCVLSGWGFCEELITRPEESYQFWCVVVWSRNLKNEEAMTRVSLQRHSKKKLYVYMYVRTYVYDYRLKSLFITN